MAHIKPVTLKKAVFEYDESAADIQAFGDLLSTVFTGLSGLATAKGKSASTTDTTDSGNTTASA